MKISEELLKKYFSGKCTEPEVSEVLKWFSTDEGTEYLNKHLDEDWATLSNEPAKTTSVKDAGIRSEEMWNRMKRNRPTLVTIKSHSTDWMGFFLKMAAMVAILVSASVIYLEFNSSNPLGSAKMSAYQTGQGQQKVLTLADGTIIRLNGNSRILIPQKRLKNERRVILKGEAYFEVKHDPKRPLVISVGNALIRDVGTKFDVKQDTMDNSVQVAVTDGEVAMRRRQDSPTKVTHLVKGQYAVMNLKTGEVKLDASDIGNYLSWVNGRITFDATSLPEICVQLHRIFGVRCSIKDKSLRRLKLTADFESHSLKQALDVISNSLNIHFKLVDNHVIWHE